VARGRGLSAGGGPQPRSHVEEASVRGMAPPTRTPHAVESVGVFSRFVGETQKLVGYFSRCISLYVQERNTEAVEGQVALPLTPSPALHACLQHGLVYGQLLCVSIICSRPHTHTHMNARIVAPISILNSTQASPLLSQPNTHTHTHVSTRACLLPVRVMNRASCTVTCLQQTSCAPRARI
jgi:hypothetical protein